MEVFKLPISTLSLIKLLSLEQYLNASIAQHQEHKTVLTSGSVGQKRIGSLTSMLHIGNPNLGISSFTSCFKQSRSLQDPCVSLSLSLGIPVQSLYVPLCLTLHYQLTPSTHHTCTQKAALWSHNMGRQDISGWGGCWWA